MKKTLSLALLSAFALLLAFKPIKNWQSKFATVSKNGALSYTPDEKGNVLPDFSRVGYYNGDKEIPTIAVVKTIFPSADAETQIRSAIDELSQQPLNKDGFRGAILLKKGTYKL